MKVSFAAALTAAAISVANAADFCDQWGQTKSGDYIIYNNMWGKADATSAKQCTGLDSGSGGAVSWHTTWSYQGGDKKVKSYPNAALEFDPVPLTAVKSIPSTMQYTVKYSGNVVADVAYDLFTSSTAGGEKEFEIMIWLAAIGGAGPISSTGKPIDTTTIAGQEWTVYSGPNGSMMVYSFVAPKQVDNFEGDLLEFFNYLAKSQSFKTSQYLIKVECGTEPFIGDDVTLTVSKYSAAVNTGGASGTTTGSSKGSSTTAQSSDSSSSEQTTTAPSTPSTPSTGASEETPATSTDGPSEETPVTSTTGSSEETPASSNAGPSEETPSTSEEEQATNAPPTPSTGSIDEPTTSSADDETTPSVATAPSTWSATSSSSGASTPSTPSTESSPDQQESTTAPTTVATRPKCTTRRVRRE